MLDSVPHSREAEEAILGGLIINPQYKLDLSTDDLYIIRNRWIYESLLELGNRADLLTLSALLEKKNQLSEIGGQDYLTMLITRTPSSANLDAYAEIVKDKAVRRKFLAMASEMASFAINETKPLDEFTSNIVTRIVQTNQQKNKSDNIASVLSGLYDQIKERFDNPKSIYGIPTGILDYDKLTYGNHPGEMTVLSGEPGIGKTKLLMRMAYGMQEHKPGVFYSMEMKKNAILQRQLSVITGVSVYKMKSGLLEGDDWDKVTAGLEELGQAQMFISDSTDWTTTALRADLARLVGDHGVGWFILDYLGKLRDRYGKDDVERTKQISEEVHNICLDLNVAGVVASSFSKEGLRGDKPKMADLSGSVQLSFNADNIIFMVDTDKEHIVKLYWDKIREGTGAKPFMKLYADPNVPALRDYDPNTNGWKYTDK